MNKERAKRIDQLTSRLEDIVGELGEIKEEEESAFDNMPESLQGSEKGEIMQSNVDNLSTVIDYITDALHELENIER